MQGRFDCDAHGGKVGMRIFLDQVSFDPSVPPSLSHYSSKRNSTATVTLHDMQREWRLLGASPLWYDRAQDLFLWIGGEGRPMEIRGGGGKGRTRPIAAPKNESDQLTAS